jgi:hypothetical protein
MIFSGNPHLYGTKDVNTKQQISLDVSVPITTYILNIYHISKLRKAKDRIIVPFANGRARLQNIMDEEDNLEGIIVYQLDVFDEDNTNSSSYRITINTGSPLQLIHSVIDLLYSAKDINSSIPIDQLPNLLANFTAES